jgi:cytochrome c553
MKNPLKIKNRMKAHVAGMVSVILLMFVLIISCEKEENYPQYNPPADHTVSQDGVMHKSGLHDPLTNCVGCHGADLQGGNVGVSCFECHSQKW